MNLILIKTGKSRARRYCAGDVQYLNEDELAAFFRSIDSARDLALMEVSFHRGLRASEVGMLQLSDLRLPVRRLYVRRAKNGNSSEYILTDRECRALRKWLAVRGHAAGPLFPSREGKPISRIRLHQLMQRYGTRAGLPESKRHFHCLRHTAGTLLAEHTDDVAAIQDHLGHRDIRSTMVYLKVRSKKRDEFGKRMAPAW
jgi:integrase